MIGNVTEREYSKYSTAEQDFILGSYSHQDVRTHTLKFTFFFGCDKVFVTQKRIIFLRENYLSIEYIYTTNSVKCQLSDYVFFLWRVPRHTMIAKTSNLHQKVGYHQYYKYRMQIRLNFDHGAKFITN